MPRSLPICVAWAKVCACWTGWPVRGIEAADFGLWDERWAARFADVDTVLRFAGNPHGKADWASVKRDNIAATQRPPRRARREGPPRRLRQHQPGHARLPLRAGPVFVDIPPAPLSPYGISKFFGEEAGRAFTEETGIDFLALRIGYYQRGENLPGLAPEDRRMGPVDGALNRDQ